MNQDRSLILDTSVRLIFHTALVFSMFLLFAGHNAPGGGFVGGLVAGAAIVLRYVQGGPGEVSHTVRVSPETLMGVGMGTAVVTAVTPWLFGGQLLESAILERSLPVLGKVKITSALPFDIGVYLVVIGLVLGILHVLGGDEP